MTYKLHALNLSNNFLSAESLAEMARNPCLRHLRILDLRGNANLTQADWLRSQDVGGDGSFWLTEMEQVRMDS